MKNTMEAAAGTYARSGKHSSLSQNTGPSAAFMATTGMVLSTWLVAVLIFATNGTFHAPPTSPPIATLVAIGVPPLVFMILMRVSPAFRRNVLRVDPVWYASVHGLRIVGAGFLSVYAFGHLPAVFAFIAGWGDILVALLAPFVATRLAVAPQFVRSSWLRSFHILGLLDFVGAVGSGLIARTAYSTESGAASTAALGELPLVLIPTFAVPLWICLHIAALIQSGAGRSH